MAVGIMELLIRM